MDEPANDTLRCIDPLYTVTSSQSDRRCSRGVGRRGPDAFLEILLRQWAGKLVRALGLAYLGVYLI